MLSSSLARSGWLPRILLVDDSEVRRQYISDWLESQGFEIVTAENGKQGLDFLTAAPAADCPELVLSDMSMPVMDGLEMLRALRANPRLAKLRVILYTTTAQVILKKDADLEVMRSGASEFLRGAIALDTLPLHLEQQIRQLRSLRSLANAREILSQPPPKP